MPSKTIDAFVLLGWLDRDAAVRLLTTECVFQPQLSAAEAEALWNHSEIVSMRCQRARHLRQRRSHWRQLKKGRVNNSSNSTRQRPTSRT